MLPNGKVKVKLISHHALMAYGGVTIAPRILKFGCIRKRAVSGKIIPVT